jgi:twitching motility protein PilT
VSLVPSLLQAIVHVDGEALVMHAGDKPYVVSPSGQVDLASRGLALEAVNGIVNQLLPTDAQRALDEFGAVQHELAPIAEFPGEQFTVVAARGGDDLWVEIRRRRIPDDDRVPEDFFPPPEIVAAAQPYPVYASAGSPSFPRPAPPLHDAIDLTMPEAEAHRGAPEPAREVAPAPVTDAFSATAEWHVDVRAIAETQASIERKIQDAVTAPAEAAPAEFIPPVPAATIAERVLAPETPPTASKKPDLTTPPLQPVAADKETLHRETIHTETAHDATPTREVARKEIAQNEPLPVPPVRPARPEPVPASAAPPAPKPLTAAPQPAVIVPLARNPIRAEPPQTAPAGAAMSGLDRLLRLAAARGASTLYLSSDSKPGVRVDGELHALDGEPVLTARDVESLLLTLMPERNHEALRTGAATEWILDIEDVGRVRCMSFRDHRGPGGVFRLMPTRSVSVDQLGLPRTVQNLVAEQEGLVLVAGPRSSGKRTLISAFVDMINRTRRDHVITIEREINIVHERNSSFVSQREVRGNDEDLLAAARAALREDPDVLVIEDLRTADLMNVAFDASASGHLVLGGFSAHTATEAVDRIIDLYGPDHRRRVQLALAESLRGVVVQVLLRKNGGGRVAARELLLNTPAVSSVIAEGKTSQLPMAIEGGRRYGMMPLNDALVGLVQQNIVDGREAYRSASDRQGLLAGLKQHGVDTSFVERLA